MKAMLVNEKQELVWSEVATPTAACGEVLVRIRAAGVNRADLLQRQGKYPSPPDCPPWMGLEIAGEVVALGEGVTRWQMGDRVCALLGGGGYAEYVAVKENMLMPIPKGFSFEEAASLPEAYATSYLNLFAEGHLQAGQTAFIPAGASGLASAAIPLAKAFGAKVITSVLTEEKKRQIEPLGADIVIVGDPAPVLETHPIHVAMDCLSGAALGQCLPYMERGGYWVVISTLAGTETTIPLRALLTKGLHIVGSMLRNRTPAFKAELLAKLVAEVWPKLESGAIRPSIYKVLPITEAAEAHAIMERGEQTGKLVLTIP